MSKFYGQVGDPYGSRTNATRCGHSGIRTSAQSYDGSVIVELDYGQDGASFELSFAAQTAALAAMGTRFTTARSTSSRLTC